MPFLAIHRDGLTGHQDAATLGGTNPRRIIWVGKHATCIRLKRGVLKRERYM